jgi:hypothetical protein
MPIEYQMLTPNKTTNPMEYRFQAIATTGS